MILFPLCQHPRFLSFFFFGALLSSTSQAKLETAPLPFAQADATSEDDSLQKIWAELTSTPGFNENSGQLPNMGLEDAKTFGKKLARFYIYALENRRRTIHNLDLLPASEFGQVVQVLKRCQLAGQCHGLFDRAWWQEITIERFQDYTIQSSFLAELRLLTEVPQQNSRAWMQSHALPMDIPTKYFVNGRGARDLLQAYRVWLENVAIASAHEPKFAKQLEQLLAASNRADFGIARRTDQILDYVFTGIAQVLELADHIGQAKSVMEKWETPIAEFELPIDRYGYIPAIRASEKIAEAFIEREMVFNSQTSLKFWRNNAQIFDPELAVALIHYLAQRGERLRFGVKQELERYHPTLQAGVGKNLSFQLAAIDRAGNEKLGLRREIYVATDLPNAYTPVARLLSNMMTKLSVDHLKTLDCETHLNGDSSDPASVE